jgi:DNA invertase Pin-like site-specific DNA recombinase
MKAAIYARFSTENQREASIEDQIRGCERVAQSQSLTVVGRYCDRAVSGGTTAGRPQYHELLAACRRGEVQILVAEDISRLWRNRAEYGRASAELEDLGIHLLTAVGDDTRRDGWGLVLGIKHSLAEYQRREISYRTRRGLEGRALAGAATGGRTYGYRDHTSIDPEQAEVVREIFSLASAGESAARIVKRLNAAGWRTPRGGESWSASTVLAVLSNPRYKGAIIWGAAEYARSAADSSKVSRRARVAPLVERIDEDARIVSEELWQAAQVGLQSRRILATVGA